MGGKFLFWGDEKLYLRGVTYGPFRPGPWGHAYPEQAVVEDDLARIAANGLNAIRTYAVPPRWLLDAAERHGLRILIGLAWEQHVAFLDDRKRARLIEDEVRAQVASCAGHPAILGYAIGNEIPAPIVRWHGRRAVERYLERLYQAAKAADPDGLVTYVNYPTTEYLELPFLDLVCFNVYLESPERFEAYLYRLQNLAGDRPLLLTELGLDSRRHGEEAQARALEWQVRTAFGLGCAGAFVFAWTDEWHRGGYDIEDWHFGLTTRDRRPKPALAAARKVFTEVPLPGNLGWPRVSVVVCCYNGGDSVRCCFERLAQLDYPDFEVIVVDDGSEMGFRLVRTGNRGLGNARNTGLAAATGEIVAYIDADAWPDPHWLRYLAATFLSSPQVAGVGGPNIAPPGDGRIADSVAGAPGGPVHVLLSDHEAEHLPGCNMAFRKDRLEAIGGFDPQFRVAGDDVDVCWRLQQRGWSLEYSPGAMVWHRRRQSLQAYWRQQYGYGKAEALLERKWPEKYSLLGHLAWRGRLYGNAPIRPALGRWRVYQGVWGSAPFQSLYGPASDTLGSLAAAPEWYLVIALLAALSAGGALWRPLLFALPALVIAVGACLGRASLAAVHARFPGPARTRLARLPVRSLLVLLHLLQPLARLCGRLRYGLTPWRHRAAPAVVLPRPRTHAFWSERWESAADRIHALELDLRDSGLLVQRGGPYDRWDLQVYAGGLGGVRLRMAVEEHGAGRQLVRVRSWPRCAGGWLVLTLGFATLAAGAALQAAWPACALLAASAGILAFRTIQDCAAADRALPRVLQERITRSRSAHGPVPTGAVRQDRATR
ncbi:MAG: glycosyltransferase [Gemmatimonadetes bacterium]|nr:glycosyltransferase [Gemmatimonadota bacterium]